MFKRIRKNIRDVSESETRFEHGIRLASFIAFAVAGILWLTGFSSAAFIAALVGGSLAIGYIELTAG